MISYLLAFHVQTILLLDIRSEVKAVHDAKMKIRLKHVGRAPRWCH